MTMYLKKGSITLLIAIYILLVGCNKSNDSSKATVIEENIIETQNILPEPVQVEISVHELPRTSRPRILLDRERLSMIINRMYGANAREPYASWFKLIKESEDTGLPVDLVNLALLYQATGNSLYKIKFLARLPTSGVPELTELYALDIMFNDIDDKTKLTIMQRVAQSVAPWYSGSIEESQGIIPAKWGYHSASVVSPAFAYAALFADTELERNKDSSAFPFNAANFLTIVEQQLAPDGHFSKIENRIAGSPEYNDALEGEPGGMYDNIGYDANDESYSMNLLLQHYVLTGKEYYKTALHEKNRASFYQNISVPHTEKKYEQNQWCRRAGTKTRTAAQVFNTQTSSVSQPNKNITAITAFLYQDQKMQYYVKSGIQKELCGQPYNGLYWELIYFDDTLASAAPNTNPTAQYYNGPGIAAMRSDWTKEAAFGVFLAGEGISRRFEDANSFLISRNTEVIPHAGARIRYNNDNQKHFWYHIRSASKNTLKIFDPDESFDISPNGTTSELHTGKKLVSSDNLGGQLFEISPSNSDLCFNIDNECSSGVYRSGEAFPLGLYETANITKFEHQENDYTYTVGDATAAYTKKIDYFEREFLFIRPDVFIIFDRVKSVHANFRKVWTIHTVDEPKTDTVLSESNMGMKRHQDNQYTKIEHPLNNTYIDTLLPQKNTTTIRGGDTQLIKAESLNDIRPVTIDMPRWLEIFISGNDVTGSLTIEGETGDSSKSTEIITFNGSKRIYYTGNPSQITSTQLIDATASWEVNQWQGHQLNYVFENEIYTTTIIGNSENVLFGEFIEASSYKYEIHMSLANSYKHWKKINSITSTDLDINNIIVSVPHYFDTEDATGRLHTFAPHTDYIDNMYQKNPNIGQWSMDVEATEPKLLDNFVHVISLKDPGTVKPMTSLISTTNAYGINVDQYLAVFSKNNMPIQTLSLEFENDVKEVLLANLLPNTKYSVQLIKAANSPTKLEISTVRSSTANMSSTSMGLLKINVD